MMQLAIFLPDWNSIESVRRAHNFFEFAALMFFAALVVLDALAHLAEEHAPPRAKKLQKLALICFAVAVIAELVAYPFSRRNDFLSDERDRQRGLQIQTLDKTTQKAQADANAASTAASRAKLDANTAATVARIAKQEADSYQSLIKSALQQATAAERDLADARNQAASANKRALEAQRALDEYKAPRTLTSEQQRKMEVALRRFAETRYEFAVDPVPESLNLVRQIDSVLVRAGWVEKQSSRKDARTTINLGDGLQAEEAFIAGVFIGISKNAAVRFGPAAIALSSELTSAGIKASAGYLKDDDPSPDNIHVIIGSKQ